MLTELFRLVIRGERGEGKTVEIAAHHLPQCLPRLPHYSQFPQKVPFSGRGICLPFHDIPQKEILNGRSSVRSSSADPLKGERKRSRRRNSSASCFDRKDHPIRGRGGRDATSNNKHTKDSFGVLSRHSSKHSLIESRHHQIVDHEPAVGAAPLSHKAARHKISVRPKRTHGIPRARKQPQTLSSSLPATPEVNEDSNLRNEKLDLSSSSAPSPSAYTQPVSNQRPTSISFSSSETHFVRRTERSDNRRAERKSLPNPPSLTLEEKKEEPFLSRLFGSVKSTQSQKETYQVVNENFPSDGGRLSREKRKDQSRPPTGTKTGRQTSDPSRFTYTEETTIEKSSSHRSSSVEGRLEGNPLYTEDGSFIHESIPPPLEFEIGKELPPPLRDFNETPTSSRTGVNPSRLSSSFDNLNDNDILPSSLSSQNQIGLSTESCEGRSSTDSLTTTPLPGIYIRSNQSLNKVRKPSGLSQAKESLSRFREEQLRNQLDIETTGPLSLDSSLNLVQHVGEEFRKTISANDVPYSRVTADNLIDNSAVSSPRSASVMRSVSVNSPASSSRASSIRSRKSSIGDELESDSSLSKVSLRKIKRESSFKSQTEEEEEKVPEFLRIQLNRVQNKVGSVVVFGTEQKSVSSSNKTTIVNVREWTDVSQRADRSIVVNVETEKPRDQSEIIVEGKNLIEVDNKNMTEEKRSSPQTIHQQSSMAFSGKGFSKKKSNEEPCQKDEEIVLRRPSVVDRSIVIDQSMGALPSPTVKGGDEPELFKVFARRSFKLKDPEMESSLENDPSDVDKENHLPPSTYEETFVNQQRRPERHSVIPSFSSGPVIKPSVPVLKNVITNRYSCGNVNIGSPHNTEFMPVSVLSNNVISSGDESDPKIISTQWESSIFKGRANEIGINITPSKSQGYASQLRKGSIPISEKNVEMSMVQDNSNQKFTKQIFYNVNQKSNQVKNFEKCSVTKINDKESPYFENVRRSTILNQSEVSDGSSVEIEQNAKTPKGQAVVWPPRPQFSEQLSESDTSSQSRSSLPCTQSSRSPISLPSQGRASLPKSKILNSFKEQHSPLISDDVESQSSGSIEEISSGKSTMSVDNRRRSLKDTTTSSNSILAEARNTTFTHSFDNHSSPLALSYLGRGETSLKLSRKGSVDESLKSAAAVEDWRVLVKQRREDRMKQTKTPDTEEIIIETRPSVSRSSKVLEMANNFQKLQVA